MSVFFIAENQQLQVPKEALSKSLYFSNLLKSQKYTEAKIIVPDWMQYRHLQSYLTYLLTESLGKHDIQSLQKFLWIGDYFQDQNFQEKIILEIIPNINRDTALLFLQDSALKISSNSFTAPWKKLYFHTKDILSKNLRYILSHYSENFDKLEKIVADDIIQDSLSWKFLAGNDNSSLIERLKILRGVENTSKLILLEENKIQASEIPCVYRWESRIKNCESELSESEVFAFDNTKWQLFYHFRQNNFRLSLRFKDNGVDENTMVAVYVKCEIVSGIADKNRPKLILLPIASLSSAIIYEGMIVNYDMVIEVFAKVQYVYSAVIQDVVVHPMVLLKEGIEDMSFDCLEFIISLKNLNVKDEDCVLEILGKWVESTYTKPNEYELKELLSCIRWDFISLKSLISSQSKYPTLKTYLSYREVFKNELTIKLQESYNRHKPRHGYKNKDLKEIYSSPSDYIQSIADNILEIDYFQIADPKETKETKENDEALYDVNVSINKQEQEFSKLKSKYSMLKSSQDSSFSPCIQSKNTMETSTGFHRVPNRLRNSSFSISSSSATNPKPKANKTGKLLRSLLKKLTPKS